MSRKTQVVTITDKNRDEGKRFKLTEMSAAQAERWAMRALLALGKSNVDVPDDMVALGVAGLAQFGIKAFLHMSFADAEPLLAEMMTCIVILPDPTHPDVERKIFEGDIEEVTTLLRLRSDLFRLHVDFSPAAST